MRRTTSLARALLALNVLLALALLSGIPCSAQDGIEPSLAPANPAFVDYVGSVARVQEQSAGEHPAGLVPEPIDFSYLKGLGASGLRAAGAYPSFYDLRTQNKLTPIRNQGACGSCWAFATIGSLESSLMPTESWDFSENNLKNLHGFDISCCSGGNRTMSTSYLTRWNGPLSEQDDPYNTGSCSSPTGLPARRHVQDVVFIPDRTGSPDNDNIKQAVMTYGAIYTSYYHSDAYYKSTTGGYYYNGGGPANHAVCIVGWDDNFDKSNFLTPPPGNGAFIIRNSWGTWWGQSGYFYISYYDSLIGQENAAFRADPANAYDTVYQYDPYGWITSSGYGTTTAWFANVFTASANSSVAAAAWYAASPNSSYELYVYTNPTNGPINASGPAASKLGTMSTAGYHTAALDTVVPVAAGQKFSVVVKITTPGYNYPVPLERPYSGYCSGATASTGQSYMSSSGTTWTDVAGSYANTNVCLKASPGSGGAPPPPNPGALSVGPAGGLTSSGTAGGPFSPSSQAYTLTNTGASSINWTAGKVQSWVTLSTSSGTLAAGATASVTVSINSGANTLAAGPYSDTVTFTNSTNGTGNTTRSVALTVNAAPPPAPGALTVTPATGLAASGSVGGPFAPGSQSYTLKNTGAVPLSWSASKTQAWVTLSAAGGTLAAGASTGVTVSVNTGANTLVAGSYSDTVTFTNATNGSGSTTRPVSLTVSSGAPPPPASGYQVVRTTISWIDPTYHARLLLGDDYVSYGQYVPFAFKFYGKTYSVLYVGSNGLVGFSQVGMSSPTNTNIPYVYYPNAAIYGYWDNLNPAAGGSVRIGTVGYAPNRKLVISYVDVPRYGSTTTRFTFQIVLCEGTNDILMQYLNVSPADYIYGGGRHATVGIENENGSLACRYDYNGSGYLANNFALRYTTQPLTGYPGK